MIGYISREAALEATCELCAGECGTKEGCVMRKRINDIPAADVLPGKWIPVTERVPEQFVSVQAHMTDAGPFPAVREAYLIYGDQWFFPALSEIHPVDMWMPFSETPKEGNA